MYCCSPQRKNLPASSLVVPEFGCSSLGHNWSRMLSIKMSGIHQMRGGSAVMQFPRDFESVFFEDISCHAGALVHLELTGNAKSNFLVARPVLFALHPKAEAEFDRLQEQRIVEPTQHFGSVSIGASVLVQKKDGHLGCFSPTQHAGVRSLLRTTTTLSTGLGCCARTPTEEPYVPATS